MIYRSQTDLDKMSHCLHTEEPLTWLHAYKDLYISQASWTRTTSHMTGTIQMIQANDLINVF